MCQYGKKPRKSVKKCNFETRLNKFHKKMHYSQLLKRDWDMIRTQIL